jgi:hypothetical protein
MNKIIFTTESSAILDFLIDFMRKTLTVKELQIFFGKDFDVYESKKTFLQKTLKLVNDEGNIEELIKKLFNPIEYINKEAELDAIITDFNKYLKFAQFKIVRTETEIFIHPLHQINTKIPRLENYNHQIINEELIKCEDSIKAQEFEKAILCSKNLIEGLLNFIRIEKFSDIKETKNLPELYKQIAKKLNLHVDEEQKECPLNNIKLNLIKLIESLAQLRNSQKLSHNDGKEKKFKPNYHHALLAVNTARTLAEFIFSSYEKQYLK